MLRQLGSLAVHGERAERLLRSAAVPRGFASSANAGGGWFGGRTSSSANVSSADDGLNRLTTRGKEAGASGSIPGRVGIWRGSRSAPAISLQGNTRILFMHVFGSHHFSGRHFPP